MSTCEASEKASSLDELKFEFKEKGKYLNRNDYNTKKVFEDLFSDKAECTTDAFAEKCQGYIGLELNQLKQKYVDILSLIEKMIDKDVKIFESKIMKVFASKSVIKDENKYISQRILNEFDGLVEECLKPYLFELLALIRVVFNKLYNKWLYDVQVIASLKLYKGTVLEMKTGEGKTYVISVTAILYCIRAYFLNLCFKRVIASCNAIPEKPVNFTLSKSEDQTYYFQVQIVTANDYLARRDYSELSSFYNFFDFSSYYIQEVGGPIPKQQYYKFEVLYCTCRNLCHLSLVDMLRKDNDNPFLSSVNYLAILDEIDQILLDEARTPHIISEGKTPENFKIDAIYQAKHIAQKLINVPYIFDYENGLTLSLLGKWFYLTKIKDFLTAYSNHCNRAAREESFYKLKKDWERIIEEKNPPESEFQIEKLLLSNNEILSFLDFFFDEHQDFIKYVIPFLLRAISIKEDVLFDKKYQTISIDDIIYELSNLARDEFKKMIVKVVTRSSIYFQMDSLKAPDDAILELIYFIFFPENFDAQDVEVLGEEYLEILIDYINSFLGQFSLSSAPLTKTIYHLMNYDLPLISEFFETNSIIEAVELNLKHSFEKCFRFVDCSSEHFDLVSDLNDLLRDEGKLSKYFEKKVRATDEVKQESLITLMVIYLRMLNINNSYHLHLHLNYIIKNHELNTNEVINKMLNSISEDLKNYSMFGCLDVSIFKKLAVWRQNLNSLFSQNLPEEIETFLNEANEALEEQTENESTELIERMIDDYKNRRKTDKHSYIQFVAANFGRIISHYKKFERDTDLTLFKRIQNLNMTCMLDYCQSVFGKNLFEEFEHHENKVPEKDEELEKYYDNVLIEYILNPYQRIKESQTSFTQHQLRELAKFLSELMRYEKFSRAFKRYYFYLLPPFHAEDGAEKVIKHRKLLPAAKVICQYHAKMLKNMMFNKGLDHIDFFSVVQRCFDALLFYKKDEDYIVSSIDEDLHPYKIKRDPYLRKNELNEVVIFDGITGRALISNRWSQHLHSSVEAKENLLVRGEMDSVAQVTPQNYFLKYKHLNGLSGTTIIAKDEFWLKYRKSVEEIPTNKMVNRSILNDHYGFNDEGTMKEMLFDALNYHYQHGGSNLIILETVEQCIRFESELNNLWKKIKSYTKELIENSSPEILEKLKQLISSNSLNIYQSHEISHLIGKMWNIFFKVDHDEACYAGWTNLYMDQDNDEAIVRMFEHQKFIETKALKEYNATTMDPGFLNTCRIAVISSLLEKDGIIPITIFKLDGTPSDLSRESEIIKLAGEMGTTLIATRVAGRGTDIKLKSLLSETDSKTLRYNPGLNILVYNHQDSRRHDQQIEGRCGRQGDLGQVRYYNSWESSYMQRIMDTYLRELHFDSDNFFLSYRFLSIKENLVGGGESKALFTDLENGRRMVQMQYEEITKSQRNYEKEIGEIVLEAQNKLNDKTDFLGKYFLIPYKEETQAIIDKIEELKDSKIKTYLRILGEAVFNVENFKYDFYDNYANSVSHFIFTLVDSGYALNKIQKVINSMLIAIYVVENDWERGLKIEKIIRDSSELDTFLKNTEQVIEDIYKETKSVFENISQFDIDDIDITSKELHQRVWKNVSKQEDRIYEIVISCFDDQLFDIDYQDLYFKKLTGKIEKSRTFRQYFFHILDSIYSVCRSECFELYSDFIESFKAHYQFSPFVNQAPLVTFFKMRSEFLCQIFTCWITVKVFASCKLLLALTSESYEVKHMILLNYLDALDIKLVKYPNLASHDQIMESIIKFFKIPLNINSFKEVAQM